MIEKFNNNLTNKFKNTLSKPEILQKNINLNCTKDRTEQFQEYTKSEK